MLNAANRSVPSSGRWCAPSMESTPPEGMVVRPTCSSSGIMSATTRLAAAALSPTNRSFAWTTSSLASPTPETTGLRDTTPREPSSLIPSSTSSARRSRTMTSSRDSRFPILLWNHTMPLSQFTNLLRMPWRYLLHEVPRKRAVNLDTIGHLLSIVHRGSPVRSLSSKAREDEKYSYRRGAYNSNS